MYSYCTKTILQPVSLGAVPILSVRVLVSASVSVTNSVNTSLQWLTGYYKQIICDQAIGISLASV